MVAVFEQRHLGLVVFGILLQPGNPLFDGAAKLGADFKAFAGGALSPPGKLLGLG